MLSLKGSTQKIVYLGLFTSLLTGFLSIAQSRAAERVEFHFEDMTFPISIDELDKWSKGIDFEDNNSKKDLNDNSDIAIWLNLLGFQSRFAVSNFLESPLITDKGMSRQLLRSWAGRKLLNEISDLIRLDDDSTGTKVFNTLENLLEGQEEVSTLSLLKALPGEVIHFDLNLWVNVVSSWKDELKRQQKLLSDLNELNYQNKMINKKETSASSKLKESSHEFIELKVPHRNEDLRLEVWNPIARKHKRHSWIVLMPGLGGDQNHFRWLALSLSHEGWPVVILDHPGSDYKALNLLLKGSLPAPGGAEVFPYRLSDLNQVLKARREGLLNVPGQKVVLMGHSLGSLTSILATGATPVEGLSERCQKALDHLSVTNLSRLLQCQLVDVPLLDQSEIVDLQAIVGINSFGSLLWPGESSLDIGVPVFFTGGTFDLITPPLSEQLSLMVAIKTNKFNRTLLIEGASHFSPIRVKGQTDNAEGEDLLQLNDSLVGSQPLKVQRILSLEIINFLESLESEKEVSTATNIHNTGIKYHILDKEIARNLIEN